MARVGVLWAGVLAAVLGILTSIEVDEANVLLVERGLALPKNRARVFAFVSNLANYAEVEHISVTNVSFGASSCVFVF